MRRTISAHVFGILFLVACNKTDPRPAVSLGMEGARTYVPASCKEIIMDQILKVGETGLILPARTKLCIGKEIKVELPAGYSFETNAPLAERTLPITVATYHCICSGGGACQVAYEDGLGFGCFHSSCPGTCTGNFIYKGYSVNRVTRNTASTDDLFNDQKVLEFIDRHYPAGSYEIFGARFSIGEVAGASCDCEGTRACVLKTKTLSKGKVIYCDGPCNGCELTVNQEPVF